MIPSANIILNSIIHPYKIKGIEFDNNFSPCGYTSEWRTEISNKQKDGKDGMGEIYCYKAYNLEQAIDACNDIEYELKKEYPDDDFRQKIEDKIDRNKPIYLQIKFTIYLK